MSRQPVNLCCVEQITLHASDGYRLAATRYSATGSLKGNLIMAGATGVQQRFYRRFAEHASAQGFNVLTIDYRGVGQSKPQTLKGFEMSYLDWGFQDLAAAVEFMADELPLYWVGHSFGGHALGLLPNHHKITAAYCYGTGAGWAGWMPRLEGLKVRLLWSCILPLIVSWKGYMAWSLLGMGDDLPLGVYKDWKRWCAHPHYFFDDPSMASTTQLYANVRMPCVFSNATDDPWAPPASRDAFIKGYRNAALLTRDLHPKSKSEPIGHMGYFRPSATPIWDEMLQWFRVVSPDTASRLRSGTAGVR
ncbi:alpha/beta hydrolase [Pseudomonas aeruginosa]|uniref:alpha/beta hydrolase family protein n=1 Tax=Pseudomonas aeruginosa TaxID=287 RepID=UPI000F529F32|nr:alpha/beta fold hydrolase [Pseudomonas aeruginosa]RQG02594.1 alpha/beta hydrolase [Pseudomonas aeruginosa]